VTNVRTAIVIGGGIAGPVAAMALRQAGIDATVYESYHGTADGIGGGLGLAPNGLNALTTIGADARVRAVGLPVAGMGIQSWTGKDLARFGTAGGEPVFDFVWRKDLYRALYGEAASRGISIEHDKRLVNAKDTGDGVVAYFADGSQATADILLGADGIRSTVRTLIDPNAPTPRYTGLLGFGGDAGITDLPSTNGIMYMIFGKRAFFSYMVEDDGHTGWFANLPHKQPMTIAEVKAIGATEWLRVLSDVFAEDRIPAVDILRRVDPADVVITGALEDLPTIPVWSKGRMVLVGDSAHATSPSSGQGASIAIESAVQLARCLRDLPSVPEAFAGYENLRRDRVEKIIAAGARTNVTKAAGPVARIVRDAVMPIVIKAIAKPEKTAWQYDYRIDWDAPVQPQVLATSGK
jgi:2-polyprenyl-6-methoxyphenol hydroxylase-like FAD-dependent oxidoreductase